MVSDADYMKILSLVTLPLTTVEVVQYVDKFAGVGVDADRIRCHMPQSRKFQGKEKATSLFACLVLYIMRNNFINVQKHQLGYDACAKLFGVSVSALRRVFTGHVRKGGKAYHKEKVKKAEIESAKQAVKQEEKRVKAAASTSDQQKDEDDKIVCKYCDQIRFHDCAMCSKQFELFTDLLVHQKTHIKKKFVCYLCNQSCGSPHQLSVHAKTHTFSCQICPKSLPSKQQLDHHMGLAYGTPVQVFQCSVCTFICTEKTVFHTHFNRDHRKFDCNFCPQRFQLQSQLDEHISKEHPEMTMADTADTAIVAPQVASPAPQQPAPIPAPTPAVPVPAPDPTTEPSADTTADQADITDMSTMSEPTLDTTGTDTTEGGRNPTSRSNRICQACQMFFEDNKLRMAHIKIYYRDLIVSCRFCRKVRFALTMDQHLNVSHAICSAYSKVFANHELLQAHHQKCKFSRPNVTLTDTDITLDPTPAASSTPCPRGEEDPAPPVQEKVTGSPGRSSRPHIWTFCKKGFDKLPILNMHKAQKHKFKVELTSCPKCSKTFSLLASMQQHHESKHKLKEFHCDIDDCDYFSNTLEQLDHLPIDMDIKVSDLFTEERNTGTRDANHTMPKVKIPDLGWKDYLPAEINHLDYIAIEQGKVEGLKCSCIECDPVETNIVEVQTVDTEQTPPPQEINSIWSQAFSVCKNIFQIPEEYRDLIY